MVITVHNLSENQRNEDELTYLSLHIEFAPIEAPVITGLEIGPLLIADPVCIDINTATSSWSRMV